MLEHTLFKGTYFPTWEGLFWEKASGGWHCWGGGGVRVVLLLCQPVRCQAPCPLWQRILAVSAVLTLLPWPLPPLPACPPCTACRV